MLESKNDDQFKGAKFTAILSLPYFVNQVNIDEQR